MSDEQNQSPKPAPRMRVSEMMDEMAERSTSGIKAIASRIKVAADTLYASSHEKTTVVVCNKVGISPDRAAVGEAHRFDAGVEMIRQQIKELEEQLRKLEEK